LTRVVVPCSQVVELRAGVESFAGEAEFILEAHAAIANGIAPSVVGVDGGCSPRDAIGQSHNAAKAVVAVEIVEAGTGGFDEIQTVLSAS